MTRIVAIDSRLTVTKAVVFNAAGRQLGVARRKIEHIMFAPRLVEHDMRALLQIIPECANAPISR